MEIHRVVGGGWELAAWDETSVLVKLISPAVGGHVGVVSTVLSCPGAAPVATPVSVVKFVVCTTGHVVDNCICVDTDVVLAASLNHAT